MKSIILGAALFTVPLWSAAQEQTPEQGTTKVSIQVVEEKGGDRILEERSYYIKPLSAEAQRNHLDSLVSSLQASGKGRRVTVTMEDTESKHAYSRKIEGRAFPTPPVPLKKEQHYSYWLELDDLGKRIDSTVSRETARAEMKVNRLMADLESRPADFGFDLNNRLEKVRAFTFENGLSNSSKTIRNASVNPNRPFDGSLNVRFNTKEKGNVVVTVTDTKGKEQGKKELKDFEGEFVGQIKLKDTAKGVLFVNIVQNEDGVTQRVMVPSAEDK